MENTRDMENCAKACANFFEPSQQQWVNINNNEYTEWLVIITIVLRIPFPSFVVVGCLFFECRGRFQRRFFQWSMQVSYERCQFTCNPLLVVKIIGVGCKGNGRLRLAMPSATGCVVSDWRFGWSLSVKLSRSVCKQLLRCETSQRILRDHELNEKLDVLNVNFRQHSRHLAEISTLSCGTLPRPLRWSWSMTFPWIKVLQRQHWWRLLRVRMIGISIRPFVEIVPSIRIVNPLDAPGLLHSLYKAIGRLRLAIARGDG